jgi:branched-chain amino acid transport system ATP-binding protein
MTSVPAESSITPVLETHDLAAGYGQLALVRDLNLYVNPGEVVALLGPNGAGKTTTLLTLAGDIPPLSGQIKWKGEPASGPLHRRVRRGLGWITEERSVFMGMTTQENLRLGRVDADRALDLFPELRPRLKVKAGDLSGGEQQMLTMCRAIVRGPSLLLVDELSLGLAPLIVQRLFRAVRDAADSGVAVILVEQHVDRALDVADRSYVMVKGRVAISGTADYVRDNMADMEASYFGASGDSA